MFNRLFLTALLLPAAIAQSAPEEPKISPFFSAKDGWGFAIECPNDPAKPGPPMVYVRLDGMEEERRGGGGSVGGVLPGQPWHFLVTIHPASPGSLSGLGFNGHRQMVATLSPGRHTASLSCGQTWSPEMTFYVDRYER